MATQAWLDKMVNRFDKDQQDYVADVKSNQYRFWWVHVVKDWKGRDLTTAVPFYNDWGQALANHLESVGMADRVHPMDNPPSVVTLDL